MTFLDPWLLLRYLQLKSPVATNAGVAHKLSDGKQIPSSLRNFPLNSHVLKTPNRGPINKKKNKKSHSCDFLIVA